jgi:hypothetical protein
MRNAVDSAVRLCEQSEQALGDVDLDGAIMLARKARQTLQPQHGQLEAAIYVRAAAAETEGLALRNDLEYAQKVADAGVMWADLMLGANRAVALAHLNQYEVWEMRRLYTVAFAGFSQLAAALPDEAWAAGLKMRCANHMLSIGVHNANRAASDLGVVCGTRVRSLVKDPDEVSAWLQWRGLSESRCYRPEAAAATFGESFELRASTPRRAITRRFLDAEIAFFESDTAGVAALSEAVDAANAAGLVRHSRAVTRHMSRYFN